MTDSYPVQLLKQRRDKYAALAKDAKANLRYAAAADYQRIADAAQKQIEKIQEQAK